MKSLLACKQEKEREIMEQNTSKNPSGYTREEIKNALVEVLEENPDIFEAFMKVKKP
ncbi:MAG: hypothetical protein ABR887_06005 [Methanoregulaceae archaeon]|jgi:hypothetical protein